MVLVQKWPFSNLFFLGNIGKENVFYDILERKKRPSSLKKQEVQKVEKGKENVFYDIVERKNDFLGCENKKFKKSKS